MNRGRQGRDGYNPSAVPQSNGRHRSSSMDIMSRGSYLPAKPRSASVERKESGIKPPLFRSAEKKGSFGNAFQKGNFANPFQKGSHSNSLARGSSLTKKGLVKDPRPLSDKAYQKQCINNLVDYLEENNFPYTIARANLLLPSRKDFELLFQFLYKFWDPKYEVQKIEDEVPKIMKSLNYPFTVTKSAIVSISRMSWPSLLGVLMWLLDLHRCCSSIAVENYISSTDFDVPNEQQILLNYICGSYETGGANPGKDREIFNMLVQKKYSNGLNYDELMEKKRELEELITVETKEQEEYQQLVQANEALEKNHSMFQDHIENMKRHMELKMVIYNKKKAENAAKEEQFQTLKAETSRLDALYKTQGFDGIQAQNFYQSQIETLNQKLVHKKREKDAEEKEFWNLEIDYANLIDKVQTKCSEFHRTYEQVQSKANNALSQTLKNTKVPAAKKLSRDYKLNLRDFDFHPKFTDDIRPVLDYAKKYMEEQRKNVQDILKAQGHHAHQMQLKFSELEMEYELRSAKTKQKEREMEIKAKEDLQKVEELKQKNLHLDKETVSIHQERKDMEERLKKLKQLKDEMTQKIELKEKELLRIQTQGANNLKEMDNWIKNTKQKLEIMNLAMMESMDTHLAFVKDNPLP